MMPIHTPRAVAVAAASASAFALVAAGAPSPSPALTCLPPGQAKMGNQPTIDLRGTRFTLRICYRPEETRDGVARDHADSIVLESDGKAVASSPTKMPVTVGRISDLTLEKSTARFAAVSYAAGENCNGTAIFDLENGTVAATQGCLGDGEYCHVSTISDARCEALVECVGKASGSGPTVRRELRRKPLRLCRGQ